MLVERDDPPLDLTNKIRRLEEYYCDGGSFGDIYRCLYDGPFGTCEVSQLTLHRPTQHYDRLQVAVKALRFSIMSRRDIGELEKDTLPEHLHREIGIWRRLDHENIVPFLGIASGFGPYTSLVSMWMPNGTLQTFLERHDDRLSDSDRFEILEDVISGLGYLHGYSVVHGDVSASNILIDEDLRACLTDFGFSSAIGNLPGCLAYLRRSTQRPGAIPWAAPEKVLPQQNGVTQLTCKSDIYSFGCIMLQVLSGEQPWSGVSDVMIPLHMYNGTNPPRPSSRPVGDQHWDFIQKCWLSVNERPSTGDALAYISSIVASFEDTQYGPSSEQVTSTLEEPIPPFNWSAYGYVTNVQTSFTTSQMMLDANSRRRRRPANFECPFCAQTFTALFSLKRHQLVHTGERTYQCGIPGCGQRFFNSSDCKRHERSKKRHKDLPFSHVMETTG